MDIVERIMEQRGAAFLEALVGGTELSADEAERFLPEAGASVGRAMTEQAAKLDPLDLTSLDNIGTLLRGIDISGLAARTGTSVPQAVDGLNTLLPMTLSFLQEHAGFADGLLGLLGGAEPLGGALGALEDLGQRFGRG